MVIKRLQPDSYGRISKRAIGQYGRDAEYGYYPEGVEVFQVSGHGGFNTYNATREELMADGIDVDAILQQSSEQLI